VVRVMTILMRVREITRLMLVMVMTLLMQGGLAMTQLMVVLVLTT
jgi:hypothetical protein